MHDSWKNWGAVMEEGTHELYPEGLIVLRGDRVGAMVERNPSGGKTLFYLPDSLHWNSVSLDRPDRSHFLS